MRKALILITSLIFASTAAAQYKWVDKNGKVQYGDTPPPGVNASTLRPPPPGAGADKAPLTNAEKDADFRKRQADGDPDRQKQAQSEQEAKVKRENCAQAKEAVRTLEAGGRLARVDEKGERYFLDDAQIAQETARARQAAQQWCN
jgi:hypothetical protein